jgi:hypothetical protein
VIDASQKCGMPEVVYPLLIPLMEKRSPAVSDTSGGRVGNRSESERGGA